MNFLLAAIKTIFRTILKTTGLVVLLILALVAFFYMTAPIYTFDEPVPFHGNFLHNPYQDIKPEHWRKYNFQVQSKAWGGLTDGRANSNNTIDSIYHLLGYDHVTISDYQRINKHNSHLERYIPVYEHGYGIRKTHQVCIGAEKVLWRDYPLFQNLSHKQDIIDKLNNECELVAMAHPVLRNGYKVDDMKYLSGYQLIEALTNMGLSMEHWDMALSHGHLVYLLATDDAHNVLNSNHVGRRFTMINAPDLKRETIIDKLDRGIAYGVDFRYIHREPMDEKAFHSQFIPQLVSAQLHGDTFNVKVSAAASIFRFVGQEGKELHLAGEGSSANYIISENDTYVRTVIRFPDGTRFFLNPVTRHPTEVPERQYIAEVDKTRTALFQGIYIVLIIILLRGIYGWQLKRSLAKKKQ